MPKSSGKITIGAKRGPIYVPKTPNLPIYTVKLVKVAQEGVLVANLGPPRGPGGV